MLGLPLCFLVRALRSLLSLGISLGLGICLVSGTAPPEEQRLIYSVPTYPLFGANFTIGGLLGLTGPDGHASRNTIDATLGIICQLEAFNEGNGQFPVNATMNFLAYDTTDRISHGVAAAVQLLRYDLQYRNGSANLVSPDPAIIIGAVLADMNVVQYVAANPVLSGLPFPVVGVNFLGFGVSYNASRIPTRPRKVPSSYVESSSASLTMSRVIIEMLKRLDWSLVTVLYGDDTFGSEGQQFLAPLLFESNILTICSNILVTESIESILQKASACLNTSDSRVVILWLSTDVLTFKVASYLQENSQVGNLIFIGPGVVDAKTLKVGPSVPGLSQFPSSFVFDSTLALTPSSAVKTCLSRLNPGSQRLISAPVFAEYWEKKFRCILPSDATTGMSPCSKAMDERNTTCLCDGSEAIDLDGDFEDFVQGTDSATLVAKSISLLEYNCTVLNELLAPGGKKDYCQQTNFTSLDLVDILDLALRSGYSEFVNLGLSDNVTESSSAVEIYQFQENGTVVQVGEFTSSLSLNMSAMYWTDGTVPESEVQVDNPTLSDAVVAVFFSFAIAEIVVSLVLKVIFIGFHRDREIRRISPLFCTLVLVGCDMVLSSLILLGFTYTTATCYLMAWQMALGPGLIIGSMLARSYRIYRIFTEKKRADSIRLKDSHLMWIVGGVLVGEVILVAIYSFAGGILVAEVVQSDSDVYYKYRVCSSPSSGVQLGLLIVLWVYNLILLLCLAVLAFLTRGVNAVYSEARGLALSVYSCITLLVIFVPLIYTSVDSTDSIEVQYAVTGMVVLLSVGGVFVFMYGPPMYRLFSRSQTDTDRNEQESRGGNRVVIHSVQGRSSYNSERLHRRTLASQ